MVEVVACRSCAYATAFRASLPMILYTIALAYHPSEQVVGLRLPIPCVGSCGMEP